MSENSTNPNPFAKNPFANAGPLAAANTSGGDEDFETYDLPPAPVGVLEGYVKDVKENPQDSSQWIISIQCTHPQYASSDPVALFLSKKTDVKRIGQIASALGIVVRFTASSVAIQGGALAMKGRRAMFVFSTYLSKKTDEHVPTINRGMPKADASPAWNEWLSQANLTDEQIKTIKSSPGAIPIGAF